MRPYTPVEVAFIPTRLDALFWWNRVVDLSFFFDICLQFFLPYQEESGVWMKRLDYIAYRYMRSYFLIDVVSTMPLDIVSVTGDSTSNLKVGSGAVQSQPQLERKHHHPGCQSLIVERITVLST